MPCPIRKVTLSNHPPAISNLFMITLLTRHVMLHYPNYLYFQTKISHVVVRSLKFIEHP